MATKKKSSSAKKVSKSKTPPSSGGVKKKILTRVEGKKVLKPSSKPVKKEPSKKVTVKKESIKKEIVIINTIPAVRPNTSILEEVPKSVKITPCPISKKAESKQNHVGFTLFDLEDAVRRVLPVLHSDSDPIDLPHVITAAITCFLANDTTSLDSKILQYALRLRRENGNYKSIMRNN